MPQPKLDVVHGFPPQRLTDYWQWCKDDKNFVCEKRMSRQEFLRLHLELLEAGLSWGILADDELVGGVIFVPQSWPGDQGPTSIDIHLSLAPKARGMGIMVKIIPLLMEIGFKEWPTALRYGATFIGNGTALERSALQAGFKYEGTRKDAILWDGQTQDLILYGMTRRDFDVLQRSKNHNHQH